MKRIAIECRTVYDDSIWTDAEKTFNISINDAVKKFFSINNGGYPQKDIITAGCDEYEVRAFLSLDKSDKNYCIEKPLHFFLENTRTRIVPLAIDSGDNYFCANNESGKVYYWRADSNTYYLIADSIEEFAELFGNS